MKLYSNQINLLAQNPMQNHPCSVTKKLKAKLLTIHLSSFVYKYIISFPVQDNSFLHDEVMHRTIPTKCNQYSMYSYNSHQFKCKHLDGQFMKHGPEYD